MEELEKNETSTQAEENTVSLASAQALADALAKIEAYTPTTWVDNSSPDIDAEHLNKPEQAIKRVTDALNSAVDVIKDLQSQVTKNAGAISDVNNNLSKAIISTDLFADYSSPTFVRWNYKTANTPYKAGLTYGQEGFALVFGSVSGWHTVISWLKGGRNMWAHYVSEGTDYGWSEYAQKSDLFGGLCTNPNTLTAFVAMVNGYDSNVTNIPDAAKKKFSIIQNVWASTIDVGNLTKTHMQVLIIGNGGGVVTRKYESSAWSNWQ